MKSVEQLNAEHAAAVAKLEAERALAAALPAVPDYVAQGRGRRSPWAVYRKRTLSQALELIALFQLAPLYKYRGTFLEITPEGKADPNATEQGGPFAIVLDVSQGEGFGPDLQLSFYTVLGDGQSFKIGIYIAGPGYIGKFDSLGAARQPIMGGRFGREVVGYKWSPNAALNGFCDSVVQWAGGDKRSCRFTYLLCADNAETLPAAEMTHAMGQLINIRDALQPLPELVESTTRADYYKLAGGTYQAVEPGAAPPEGFSGYYDLESLKRLKGDSK